MAVVVVDVVGGGKEVGVCAEVQAGVTLAHEGRVHGEVGQGESYSGLVLWVREEKY